jgi:hypothetical protein
MSEWKYFFNDAQVTEAEYKELMSGSRVDVPAKFHMTKPVEYITAKTVEKSTKKMPKKVVTKVSSGKSKIDQAIEIVNELKGTLTKDQLITQLQLKLGDITKGNATIYYNKAIARGVK